MNINNLINDALKSGDFTAISLLIKENPEEAEKLLKNLYNEIIQSYKGYIDIIPILLKYAGDDLSKLIKIILNLFNGILENEEMSVELGRFQKNIAMSRMKLFNTYQEMGFERNEALALVISDGNKLENYVKKFSK